MITYCLYGKLMFCCAYRSPYFQNRLNKSFVDSIIVCYFVNCINLKKCIITFPLQLNNLFGTTCLFSLQCSIQFIPWDCHYLHITCYWCLGGLCSLQRLWFTDVRKSFPKWPGKPQRIGNSQKLSIVSVYLFILFICSFFNVDNYRANTVYNKK